MKAAPLTAPSLRIWWLTIRAVAALGLVSGALAGALPVVTGYIQQQAHCTPSCPDVGIGVTLETVVLFPGLLVVASAIIAGRRLGQEGNATRTAAFLALFVTLGLMSSFFAVGGPPEVAPADYDQSQWAASIVFIGVLIGWPLFWALGAITGRVFARRPNVPTRPDPEQRWKR